MGMFGTPPARDEEPEEDVAAVLYAHRQEATYQWRLRVFVLAFEKAGGRITAANVDALDELARSGVDTHRLEACLLRGCAPELAVKIFL